MEKMYFDDYESLACDIADKFGSLEEENNSCEIVVIAKYSDAREVIKELIGIGHGIANIEISDEYMDGYSDEYIISLGCGETDGVWCEKFKRENGYLNDESDVAYIMSNVSSEVLQHFGADEVYEVHIGERDEGESIDIHNTEAVHISKTKDGTPTGFSKSWSKTNEDGVTCYSSYSYYCDNADFVRAAAKDFGVEL